MGVIYLGILLYFDDPSENITTDFTLILDSFMCICANCVTNIAMFINCKKLSSALNELITVESTFLPMAKSRIKCTRNQYFLALFSVVSWIMLISVSIAVTEPFGYSQSTLQGVHFFIGELMLLAVICSYYGFIIFIGFLYEELKEKLRMWMTNINTR